MATVKTILFDTRRGNWRDNPYIDQLATSVATDVEILGFSWKRFVLGKFDVMHVHWPEHILLQPTSVRTLAARLLFSVALIRLRAGKKPIVRTMHNRTTHVDVPKVDQFLLERFDRLTYGRIWLSEREDEDGLRNPHDSVILHGDYRPWIAQLGITPSPPSRGPDILCFGVLRRYKKFEEAAYAAIDLQYPRLTIAGVPAEADYAAELRELALRNPERVVLVTRRLDDSELAGLIETANLVIVPYENLYNSGVVLLALSLQRPVVLRDSETSRGLAAEYGDFWIRRYTGILDSAQLDELLNISAPVMIPAFSANRTWENVGRAHREMYARALENI